MRPLGPTLWHLGLETETSVEFQPGQYAELEVRDRPGLVRTYSIATPPGAGNDLAFVIRRHEAGAFSGDLGVGLQAGTRIDVRGPYGDMYLRRSGRPVVLVGAGSGIAPLLSIIEHLALAEPDRPVRLVYGARTRGDLLAEAKMTSWRERLHDLAVHLILSDPASGDDWQGPVGRVQSVMGRAAPDEWDVDVYACGPPALCADVVTFFEARGVPASQIHTDAFHPNQ